LDAEVVLPPLPELPPQRWIDERAAKMEAEFRREARRGRPAARGSE
jgi:hypothetical protein